MLATKRSAGVAPEVNLREHVKHTPLPSLNKAAHSGFETQRRCHQKFKTGVSVAPQKGLMSSKNFLKKFYFVALMLYLNDVHGVDFPPSQHWFCVTVTPVLWTSTLSSTLFILSMTFDRVYSIIRPHKAASFNTVKRAKFTIFLISIISCLFNIPYVFTISSNGAQCITDLSKFGIRFYFWLTCVVQFVIPFVLLLVMNSVIIHTLRTRSSSLKLRPTTNNQVRGQSLTEGHSKDKGQDQVQGQSQQRQIFAILLLVAFSFFVLITPLYALNVNIQAYDYAYEIVIKLYFTNNAINFFLYVISGQKFRKDLIYLFKWNKEKSKKKSLNN